MKTFKGVPVPPIDEILERTIYAKTKNAEIERLTEENEQLRRQFNDAQAEIERLTNVGLDAAYGEAIKADEANDYYAEAEHLHRLNQQLADERDALETEAQALIARVVELEADQTASNIRWQQGQDIIIELAELRQQLAEEKIERLRAIIKELEHQLNEADEAAEEYAVEGDQYRYQLMAAEDAIEAQRWQLDEAQRWQPVVDDTIVAVNNRRIVVFGREAAIYYGDDGWPISSLLLPDNVRLCRLVEGQPPAG